jgi:hypothetical protein
MRVRSASSRSRPPIRPNPARAYARSAVSAAEGHDRLMLVIEVAEYLRTSEAWVPRHQAELGGFKLSDGGGRNPIRFRREDVDRFLEQRRLTPPPAPLAPGHWRSDPEWAVR